MHWEIDVKNKILTLENHYHIPFDRLEETDWIVHLSQKNWVNMNDLFEAFIEAYKFAEYPLTKDLFYKFNKAYHDKAEDMFYDQVFNLFNSVFNENKVFSHITGYKDKGELIGMLTSRHHKSH